MNMRSAVVQSRRNYNIIIFGATSFTGKWLVHELIKTLNSSQEKDNEGLQITWAIAGRSFKKMEQLLEEIGKETRQQLLGKVDMIEADVSRPSSIFSMVQQCQLILNCVGPYQLWGECVVKACAEYGTHHLDLSGEPLFLGQMELKYSEMAERSGAYIIGACGLESIPSDCGSLYLQKNFEGTVNSIEIFLECPSDSSEMSEIHSGTWKSAVWCTHYFLNYILMKGELSKNYCLPISKHQLSNWPIQYRKEVNSWCLFSPFPDGDVLDRTQRYIVQNKDDSIKPFQGRFYFQLPGLLYIMICLIFGSMYSVIAQVKWGASLLAKYPKVFTFGRSSDEGPSVESMNQTKFTFTIIAKGWSENNVSIEDKNIYPPNKMKILRVKGNNPGYGATVKLFLQAALTILIEKDKMPKNGGVYSPGIAFANTNLIERLNKNGVTFTIDNKTS